LVSTNGQPLPMNGPPTLSLLLLLKTARIAWKGEEEEEEVELEELDQDDIESIAVSLMDQVSLYSLSPLFLSLYNN